MNDDVKLIEYKNLYWYTFRTRLIVRIFMETLEFAVELHKIEDKDIVEWLYAMFQIREAVSCSQMFLY